MSATFLIVWCEFYICIMYYLCHWFKWLKKSSPPTFRRIDATSQNRVVTLLFHAPVVTFLRYTKNSKNLSSMHFLYPEHQYHVLNRFTGVIKAVSWHWHEVFIFHSYACLEGNVYIKYCCVSMERYVLLYNISISVASLVKKNKEDKYYSKKV